MNIDNEIQNLTDLRQWLMEHKGRFEALNMNSIKQTEDSIKHLDVTLKRLRIAKRQAQAQQSKLEL